MPQSGAALFNTAHVVERCQSSRSPPSSRHTLPSGTSLLAPGPTSTRTQPGQVAATRATVRLPDVRSTATCQKGEGSAFASEKSTKTRVSACWADRLADVEVGMRKASLRRKTLRVLPQRHSPHARPRAKVLKAPPTNCQTAGGLL